MTQIGVRILGGVDGYDKPVRLQQVQNGVEVTVGISSTAITPAAARELARQLYVIAKRVTREQGQPASKVAEVRRHA